MTGQSNARAQRRAMKRAGVGKLTRFVIEGEAVRKLEATPGDHDVLDLVMYNVDAALRQLVSDGADVFAQTVVTIGRHPDFPDAITVEAKTP